MSGEESRKVTTLLVENLKEAIKAVDMSFLWASISVVFLLIHGLQGDYLHTYEAQKEAAQEETIAADEEKEREDNTTRSQETVVPILGLKARLLTASLFALTLYWIFCFRAAFRVRRASVIARRLSEMDKEVLSAVLLYPSLATSSRSGKIARCAALGALGVVAFLFMYQPLRPLSELLWSASAMLIPPGYLCWWLLAAPLHERQTNAA